MNGNGRGKQSTNAPGTRYKRTNRTQKYTLIAVWCFYRSTLTKVWPEDLKDGGQEGYGVESVRDVAARIGRMVRLLEVRFDWGRGGRE